MPGDTLVYFGAVVVVFAFAAWAGWAVAGRRKTEPKLLPDRVWLCDACKSFNDPTHTTCYRCHQPRPADATYLAPEPEFRVDQQLGRPKGSTQLGRSSAWLAGEEPLRDAWLSEQARASEQALQASEPAPAFWTTEPGPDATPTTQPPLPERPPEQGRVREPEFKPFWETGDPADEPPGPDDRESSSG